jgi:ATP-binding cassette subfamily F protein uup
LDEPTNDLDLPTLSVLENFLLEFEGCLVIVSHDRYFMDRLVNHLFVFEGEGVVSDFPGNFSQYREGQKIQNSGNANEKREKKTVDFPAPAIKRKISYNDQREIKSLEKDISELENERKQLFLKLNESGQAYDQVQQISAGISKLNEELDKKEMRWLELSEII